MTTTTTRTAPAASSAGNGFFNFHASGVGWMNRIRTVQPRRGEPFLACSISALHGRTDKPERTCLDLRVSGEEAQRLVGRLQKHCEAGKKVFVSFKAGDLYPHLYERKSRETGKPETAALIKGRLLSLQSITINGKKVWPAEVRENAPAAAPAPAPAPEPAKPAFTKNVGGVKLEFHEAGAGCYAAVL